MNLVSVKMIFNNLVSIFDIIYLVHYETKYNKRQLFESHTKCLHNTKITLTINKYIELMKGTYYNKF